MKRPRLSLRGLLILVAVVSVFLAAVKDCRLRRDSDRRFYGVFVTPRGEWHGVESVMALRAPGGIFLGGLEVEPGSHPNGVVLGSLDGNEDIWEWVLHQR